MFYKRVSRVIYKQMKKGIIHMTNKYQTYLQTMNKFVVFKIDIKYNDI